MRCISHTKAGDKNMKNKNSPKVSSVVVVAAVSRARSPAAAAAAEAAVTAETPSIFSAPSGGVSVDIGVDAEHAMAAATNEVILSVTQAQKSPTHSPEASPQVYCLILHTATPHTAAAGAPTATAWVLRPLEGKADMYWPDDDAAVGVAGFPLAIM